MICGFRTLRYKDLLVRNSEIRYFTRKQGRLHLKTYIAVIFLALIVGFILTHRFWLPMLYTYLNKSQPAKTADIIVVLGGSNGRREAFALTLYNQKYAPKILVSGHRETMKNGLNLIEKSNLPKEALLINDQATTTYDEAQQILNRLIEIHAKSVLIVTDQFHTRRASATYQKVFQEYDIKLTFVSLETTIDSKNWWQTGLRPFIELEYLKILYYWFAYGIWSG